MMDLYLQMGIALILVSGVIILLGLFVKKRQDKEGLMKIMGYQSLGPKKGLAMVRVGREVLLVGVTATDVKLLKSMDRAMGEAGAAETAAFAEAAASSDAREAPQPRFDEELAREQAPTRGRVIVADVSSTLHRLKALKDQLVCS
jgi:flagellar protein FliO/FliZ